MLFDMNSGHAAHASRVPVCYRIVVRGEITERFADVLEGIVVESAGDESTLQVENADQAKLHSVLGWLYDHGVALVSLRRAD
jgi:hypothetical protein